MELGGDSDLGRRGRADSRLPEHDTVEWARVGRQGGRDRGVPGHLRAVAHNERSGAWGGAGAMKDIVHDGYGCACIHQHGASGQVSMHVVVVQINLGKDRLVRSKIGWSQWQGRVGGSMCHMCGT